MAKIVDLDNPKIIKVGRSGVGAVIYHIPPDTPIIEAEQTKHGQWIPGKEIAREFLAGNVIHVDYLNYHCSICGAIVSEQETMMYHYCPNCGAKMDEDKNGR